MVTLTKKKQGDRELLQTFGFKNEQEFAKDAVEEKKRRLRSILFSRTAEKVRRGLVQRGTQVGRILRDFESFRRS